MTISNPLFSPLTVGKLQLAHRIVLAPLTRNRATKPKLTANELMAEYYEQRASEGGLLITEATYVSPEAGGYPDTPGIWSKEQVESWKQVTDRVHKKGGYIYCQLWALGRANGGSTGIEVVSSGNLKDESGSTGGAGGAEKATPRSLTIEEIEQYVKAWGVASKNAVDAGFDGVEIHGAHGYLVDQFTQPTSNNRTDKYGGSLENRLRFALEVVDSCCKAIGQEKVGIRLAPYSTFQGMYDPSTATETFTTLASQIHKRFPSFAYVHMVESRGDPKKLQNWSGASDADQGAETLDQYREIFADSATTFLSAGGYSAESARKTVEEHGGGVVFGRLFISNPDLPKRLKEDLPLTHYDRSTFYTHDAEGYTTYPSYDAKVSA